MEGEQMKFIGEFIDNYGMTIVYALLTAIAGFIATKIKAIYEAKCDDETKKRVVRSCVKAVEQLYNDLGGAEKLERAKTNIIQILEQKGIMISELELDMLIEEVVAEFNFERLWGSTEISECYDEEPYNYDTESEVSYDDLK